MQILALLVLIFLPSYLFAITPASIVDGKVVFTVITDTSAVQPTPTVYEKAIKDSGLKFVNYSEYEACVLSTTTLQDKIDDLKPSDAKRMSPVTQALKDAMVAK